MFRRGSARLLSMLLCALCSCEEQSSNTGGGYVGSTAKASVDPGSSAEAAIQPPAEVDSDKEKENNTAAGTGGAQTSTPENFAELTKVWGLGELADLGPAGPATATDHGVYFVTRLDQVAVARRKGKDGFIPLDADARMFAKYGRGPAVSKTHAYWVSERRELLRLPIQGGKFEVLFDRARIGTRTSVITAAGRDVVSFIAEIDKEPFAFVWASGGSGKPELLRLTPQGATATSATLVKGEPHPRAIILAGRLGMSPVHVRRIRTTRKRLTLEPDEVVWVGPGSHTLTEIHAIGRKGDEAVAFLPTAKDFNDFGLAQLSVPSEPGEIEEPGWLIYPNGLDPAPVATGRLCNKDYLLFARPSGPKPRSPQELHIVPVSGPAPGQGEVIARSRAFNDLSLAPTKNGAVLAWTADRRTWGMVITCPAK